MGHKGTVFCSTNDKSYFSLSLRFNPDTGDFVSTEVINNGYTYSIKFLLEAQF